jgi:hypothetical protein
MGQDKLQAASKDCFGATFTEIKAAKWVVQVWCQCVCLPGLSLQPIGFSGQCRLEHRGDPCALAGRSAPVRGSSFSHEFAAGKTQWDANLLQRFISPWNVFKDASAPRA